MNDLSIGREADGPAPRTHRGWLAAGWLCLAVGTLGIVVPLLPTVDFYGLAACCFARGSRRWEAWLLNHPRLGPLVRDWRAVVNSTVRRRPLSEAMACPYLTDGLVVGVRWVQLAPSHSQVSP